MAGMLPGVEAARRRRIHQSSRTASAPGLGIGSSPSSSSSTRRSSFSLFVPSSSPSSLLRSRTYQDDEKLGQLAREAKERLDERLRAQRQSLLKRMSSEESMNNGRELRREVYGGGSKKNGGGSKRLMMMGWAAKKPWGEQEECVVCLEEFRVGDNLVNLPCAHRFHSRCLVPWLETNAHCPCCRMSIISQQQ